MLFKVLHDDRATHALSQHVQWPGKGVPVRINDTNDHRTDNLNVGVKAVDGHAFSAGKTVTGQITGDDGHLSAKQVFNEMNKQADVVVIPMYNHRCGNRVCRQKRLHHDTLTDRLEGSDQVVYIGRKTIKPPIRIKLVRDERRFLHSRPLAQLTSQLRRGKFRLAAQRGVSVYQRIQRAFCVGRVHRVE